MRRRRSVPIARDEPLRIVPDASVAVKWFVPEERGDAALRLLEAAACSDVYFFVPDLWFAEVASTLWKKTRRTHGALPVAQAARCIERLASLPVTVSLHDVLLPRAFRLAVRAGITVYDALYVALAEAENAALVTADTNLADRTRPPASSARIVRLGDPVTRIP